MSAPWVNQYVGRDYDDVGRCWGLCRLVWGEQFGIAVADIGVDENDRLGVRRAFRDFGAGVSQVKARSIAKPFIGVAVYMTQARLPDHIGIWVDADGAGILHALKGSGVVCTRPSCLRSAGLSIHSYYAPQGLTCPPSMS